MNVELEKREWDYVLAVLGDRPWKEVAGLMMKVGGQMQRQQAPASALGPQVEERKDDEKRLHARGADRGNAEYHQ